MAAATARNKQLMSVAHSQGTSRTSPSPTAPTLVIGMAYLRVQALSVPFKLETAKWTTRSVIPEPMSPLARTSPTR